MRSLPRKPFLAAAISAALLLSLDISAQSLSGHRTASATMRIQIVVLPYVRVLRNVHPQQIGAQNGSTVSAEQHLSVVTNERHGFCLDVLPALPPDALGWQLQGVVGDGVSASPFGEGYRVCSARHGTFAFTLVHRFTLGPASAPLQTPWPIVAALAQM